MKSHCTCKLPIVQLSHPRSGSTLVWQILTYLFDTESILTPGRQHKVIKSHRADKLDINKMYVITIRDPRDSLASLYKIGNGSWSQLFKNGGNIDLYNTIYRYRNDKNVCILRYELFYDDYNYIFDTLEEFFDVHIDEHLRDEIRSRFSRDSNKEIANKYKQFKHYDKKTHIHGSHINSNTVSHWRQTVPEKYHKQLNEKYKKVIDMFKYN